MVFGDIFLLYRRMLLTKIFPLIPRCFSVEYFCSTTRLLLSEYLRRRISHAYYQPRPSHTCRVGIQPPIKTISIKTGMPYFTQRRAHTGKLIPEPLFASEIKLSHPQPRLVVQNKIKTMHPITKILLDKIKSSSV